MSFTSEPLTEGAALVTVTHKLRGSAARQLGEQLEDLATSGHRRVVLDLQALSAIDSLATQALEEAVSRGLMIHLVVRPGFLFDPFFQARVREGRGLRVHRSLPEALTIVRGLVESGLALV